MVTRLYVLLIGSLLAWGAGGCGSPGAPQPPSLKLPAPPGDLAARRSADTVTLTWTMPTRATDRVPLSGDQHAVICRALDAEPCRAVGAVLLQPGAPAAYHDQLAPAFASGPARRLTYTVLLENRRGVSAGASNAAYTAAGAAPPQIEALQASATAEGIALRWRDPPGAAPHAGAAPDADVGVGRLYRLTRTQLDAAKPGSPAGGVQQRPVETLELADSTTSAAVTAVDGWTINHAVDRRAQLNHSYRYSVERIVRLSFEGHPVEIAGPPAETAPLDARDTFPPVSPKNVNAVADSDGGAIDVSWTAGSEPDVAGYIVYRRTAGSSQPPLPVSGLNPVPEPGWRDTDVQPGDRYAYSVSAVDTSGNASPRSAETEESLPGSVHTP